MKTKTLVFAALLAAMAVALKFYSFTTLDYRFTFYDIPLMVTGIIFGPLAGGIAGFITDWIYALAHGYPLGIFTLSSIMWGFLPGLLMVVLRKVNVLTLIVIVLSTSVLAFLINTVALYVLLNGGIIAGLPARIITMIIKWPIQVIVLKQVYERVILPLKIRRA